MKLQELEDEERGAAGGSDQQEEEERPAGRQFLDSGGNICILTVGAVVRAGTGGGRGGGVGGQGLGLSPPKNLASVPSFPGKGRGRV